MTKNYKPCVEVIANVDGAVMGQAKKIHMGIRKSSTFLDVVATCTQLSAFAASVLRKLSAK